jgi:diguanylate cyclase (GGDEF)-like protein
MPNAQLENLENRNLLRELDKAHNELRLYRAVVENFPGGIVLTDQNLEVVVCNEQQKKLLNYAPELFEGRTPTLPELFRYNAARGEYGPGPPDALVAAKMDLVEQRIPHMFERVRPDGRVIEVRGVPIMGGGFVTSYIDITERRKTQEMVLKLALTDTLTGLSNRVALAKDFEHFAARARRGEHFAVMYIDLDDFKPVNDKYGHRTGDALLEEVAGRLKANVRDTDVVARYGGDEFIILQSAVLSSNSIKVLAQRTLDVLQAPFYINNIEIRVSGSMGIVHSANMSSDFTIDNMLGIADVQMYMSKSFRKGMYHIDGCADKSRCCLRQTCTCDDAAFAKP